MNSNGTNKVSIFFSELYLFRLLFYKNNNYCSQLRRRDYIFYFKRIKPTTNQVEKSHCSTSTDACQNQYRFSIYCTPIPLVPASCIFCQSLKGTQGATQVTGISESVIFMTCSYVQK